MIKSVVPPDMYEAYHMLALQHFNQKINVRQFRSQLEALFREFPPVLDTLSIFFSESPTFRPDQVQQGLKPDKADFSGSGTKQGKAEEIETRRPKTTRKGDEVPS